MIGDKQGTPVFKAGRGKESLPQRRTGRRPRGRRKSWELVLKVRMPRKMGTAEHELVVFSARRLLTTLTGAVSLQEEMVLVGGEARLQWAEKSSELRGWKQLREDDFCQELRPRMERKRKG